jgi:hypothetical protein
LPPKFGEAHSGPRGAQSVAADADRVASDPDPSVRSAGGLGAARGIVIRQVNPSPSNSFSTVP